MCLHVAQEDSPDFNWATCIWKLTGSQNFFYSIVWIMGINFIAMLFDSYDYDLKMFSGEVHC